MNFTGIDLSLVATGVVTINKKGEVVGATTIRSKPVGDKPQDELDRLIQITKGVMDHVSKFAPTLVSIEGLAFMARNTTALVQLSGLNYLVRYALSLEDVPFTIVAPTTLKKFGTGKGNGDKSMILLKTYENFGYSAANDNECDAYLLAQIARHVSVNSPRHAYQQEVVDLIKTQLP